MNGLRFILKFWILINLTIVQTTFAGPVACNPATIAEFKKLYLELQQKLNYEGKETVYKNGILSLNGHTPNSPYGGKVFEENLYKEYQNTLKKVAKLYQTEKFDNKSNMGSSNPTLVSFIKSIDESSGTLDFNKNASKIIDEIVSASSNKFKDDNLKKYALNEEDKYLLKKLLTHAQDRVCSVAYFDKTGNRTKYFSDSDLKKIQNAPLNRLIKSLKDANIGKDSIIEPTELVITDAAITQAIADNVNDLKKWMNKNSGCKKNITNPNFIQHDMQSCNYNKFLDSLSDSNLNNIESILHFINTNEKFLNHKDPLAETALDENKLEYYISQTFKDLQNKIQCEYEDDKFIVRNLPYDNTTGKHLLSEIICKIDGKVLEPNKCSENILQILDSSGSGLEIKQQKNRDIGIISFSIKSNPNCEIKNNNIELHETCIEPKIWNKKENKCTDNKAKTTCTPPQTYDEKENKCVKVGMGLKESKSCVEAGGSVGVSSDAPACCSGLILAHSASDVMGTAGKCVKVGMGLKESKSCVEAGGSVGVYPNAPECCSGLFLAHSASDVMGSAGKCIENKAKTTCTSTQTYDEKENKCTENKAKTTCTPPQTYDEKENKCTENKAKTTCTPPQTYDEKENKCTENNAKTTCTPPQTYDEKENKCTPPVTETKLTCIPPETWNEKEKKCTDNRTSAKKCTDENDKENEKIKDASIIIKWIWDEKNNKCTDKTKEESKQSSEENPLENEPVIYADKPIPGRFVPITIPIRKTIILPGMP